MTADFSTVIGSDLIKFPHFIDVMHDISVSFKYKLKTQINFCIDLCFLFRWAMECEQ